MLNRIMQDEECDATEADSSNVAGTINKKKTIIGITHN
jgi:hypothetical protein